MKEEDVYYLLTRLSADAAPAIADMDLSGYEDYVRGDVYQYFCDIAEKNQGIYLRKANYSRIGRSWRRNSSWRSTGITAMTGMNNVFF